MVGWHTIIAGLVAVLITLGGCAGQRLCQSADLATACEALRTDGTAEVIVTLRSQTPAVSVGQLQARVIQRLDLQHVQVLEQLQTVPVLVLRVDRRGLRQLHRDPDIANIASNEIKTFLD